MPRIHVAIVDNDTAQDLLSGRKRVESRFARHRRPPYGCVSRGDHIYFKHSGDMVIGRAAVTRVLQFDDLTPGAIEDLRRRYNHAIRATPAYWYARRNRRFGVLIWLARLRPPDNAPAVPRQYGNGWILPVGEGC